ncbi:MAG: DNA repair protein RecO [Pseudomonadales bacterium]|jgi:DNA repair protein RecO (recombination protein O)|nr:DNA repair protein RecO [Pseudomonadales bacterium]MCC6529507.1 DNA repair protein RecO [Pseudomonadales bacterium]MCP5333719.1 DNA repair protein RecO [Pseudomonadales bacterium]HMU90717.1 DNA repair protein RecO [Pseudomonadales bacterium]HMW15534.1 DNA repair protein RecO [Pseudomonadales bacterium]
MTLGSTRPGDGTAEAAFVLHHRPYQEHGQLLDCLTREAGLLRLVARGSRGGSRNGRLLGALLQPFAPLRLAWSGRGELKSLTAAEASGMALTLRGERWWSGCYLNELLLRLLSPFDPHPALFQAYGRTVTALAGDEAVAPLLRRFEWRLLTELGYAISFDHTLDGALQIDVASSYRFDPAVGFIELARHEAASGHDCFSGAILLALAHDRLSESAALQAAKRLNELALAPHLRGRPLQTRALYRRARVALSMGADRDTQGLHDQH